MCPTEPALLPQADDGACCAPLAEPPLDGDAAVALAHQLKALADPAGCNWCRSSWPVGRRASAT